MPEPERIVLDPAVLTGKPVIRGTRLAVAFVIGLMADGWTEGNILQNYPGISHQDLAACLAYARDVLRSETAAFLRANQDRHSDTALSSGRAVRVHRKHPPDRPWLLPRPGQLHGLPPQPVSVHGERLSSPAIRLPKVTWRDLV